MYSLYGELCTEVYDLSKPLGFSFGDVEYYLERLKEVKGKVLEVGCGSGRVLIPLLQAGIDMEGVDNSAAMLDSCRRRVEELGLATKLYEDEMHNFALTDSYEAIIIPAGSFQLVEGREQAVAALHHFYSHLKPGGRLIMDLFIPTDIEANHASTRTWETSDHEVIILEERITEMNLLEQKTVSIMKYEKWKEGNLIQTELQRFPLSWYGYHEFELMLEKQGYEEITKSADYAWLNKPVKADQMITFEARKAPIGR
ncbi:MULTISPECIES: class I SAM-dependent methyltransferase [Paenibacillus]|uniref:SAM-dependent methyltransferase n=1 Tax=Paenibacillus lautus TaxID=1401 RepID=A0A1R1AW17_PAELA|nr:class I SAM-dependent methyltransferase [Paenibacillus lautus]OME89807.1 SAM-dependent methyltransferase [Paenibacillus lautus]